MEHGIIERKPRPRLNVIVMTGAQDADRPESRSINWLNRSDRKWLESHMHWAMSNGQVVVLQSKL